MSWVRQINVSSSSSGVIRGMHAQSGPYCQGKLVKALTYPIYDVITDARPDSKTFGTTSVYLLDPNKQNQLWVPRGFLHSFAVPKQLSMQQLDSYGNNTPALFEYFCDNVYSKQSEVGVNPMSVLPSVAKNLASILNADNADDFAAFMMMFETADGFTLSEKDKSAKDYNEFMNEVKTEYEQTGKVWYK